MLKKGKRLTKRDLKKEQKRYKEVSPIYENKDITTFETYVANAFTALADTTKKLDINKEYVELVVWLYQFEFFERKWVYENFSSCYMRKEVYGERSAKNRLSWVIDNGYAIEYSHKKIKYETYERGDGFYRMEEVVSDVKYKLSEKGLNVVRIYLSMITKEPLSVLEKRKNKILYSGQAPWDNIDYSTF